MEQTLMNPDESAFASSRGVRLLLATIAATAVTMASVIVWATGGASAASLLAMISWPWILMALAWSNSSLARRPRRRTDTAQHVPFLTVAHER